MEYKKYLPLGSVVLLKGGKKRLMITGFCIITGNDKDGMFDYCGCLYPEGSVSSEKMALFNHDQIKKIYAIGFSDDEEKEFKKKLDEMVKKEI